MVPFFCLLGSTGAAIEAEVRSSLISFLGNLSNHGVVAAIGWKQESDPCVDGWNGIACDAQNASVTKLRLEGFNLSGSLDMGSLCNMPAIASSLARLVLNGNNLGGGVPAQISICRQLTHLQIGGNKFEGELPDSLATLDNLKVLNVSYNNFSGNLPNLSRISGLQIFLAQDNQLSGKIPAFDFYNFDEFNVSYNNFSGQIPDVQGYFNSSSFIGNPFLCGYPLPNNCPQDKRKGVSGEQVLMYSGYALLGSLLVGAVGFKLCNKKMKKTGKVDSENSALSIDGSGNKATVPSSEHKTSATLNRPEVSATSVESGVVSSSLVVVTRPTVNGLMFEELLRAPAELLGRGRHGSLYKVICENGAMYAVKRIKDWAISGEDFKKRMQRIDQVKHPNVLPAAAFYSSQQEKLLVYEFQQNGSLFRLLHGTQMGRAFEWGSRLNFAASIAKGLATMHRELRDVEIAHGNLKSSNILLTKDMEPCISEYGLMVLYDHQDLTPSLITPAFEPNHRSNPSMPRAFGSDVYGFGVILLELLTGKMVHDKGFDLPKWVLSVVQEEWTVEVFDKSLILEGVSEERMVNLLQVAIKCVNRSPEARPSMTQVTSMIATIKEEEDRSLAYET